MTIKSMDLGTLSGIRRHRRLRGSTTVADLARPAILGAFLGRLSVKRVPNSRLIEVRFEARRSATGGASGQRAPAKLHRTELPKQIRRDDAGVELAVRGTGRTAHQGGEIGRRADRVRARKSDLADRREAGHHHAEARRPEQSRHRRRRPTSPRKKRCTAWRSPATWTRCRRRAPTT